MSDGFQCLVDVRLDKLTGTEVVLHTSSKPKNIPSTAHSKKKALTMLGAAYGYFLSHAMLPNSLG